MTLALRGTLKVAAAVTLILWCGSRRKKRLLPERLPDDVDRELLSEQKAIEEATSILQRTAEQITEQIRWERLNATECYCAWKKEMKTFVLPIKVEPERQVPAGERSDGKVRGPAHRQLLRCNDHAFGRPAKVKKCDKSSVKVSWWKNNMQDFWESLKNVRKRVY